MLSTDPEFETKAADVIGLYLDPPQHAVVFCIDEKTAIQALDRLDPVPPLSPALAERHGFEYYRHGTLSLYAALNTATGRVHGKTAARHTSREFVAFLQEVLSSCPPRQQIHIILDNLSAHKTHAVRQFLQQHPRVQFHFTPTYSSWLNQVEIWFAKIEREVIARGIFTSVSDLARKLRRYINAYSANARPALDRLDPVPPLSPALAERHGFEYYRHGTLSLYAALNTATGRVHGKTAARHTSREFVAFLQEVLSSCPPRQQIHIILDNLSAHKTHAVRQFLQQHPRVQFHFTPTYSSWLNQVEIWFAKIEREVIARGIFTSVSDLARKLRRYINAYSANARPALDRLDPVLPLSPARAERHGFEYYRHGTLSLYAALNTATGRVHGKTAARHTSREFVAFLQEVLSLCPPRQQIHIILDNLSAHKTQAVREFLQQHPRVRFHFTPTYSSWLNQVEIWFAKIEREVIARGIFTSVSDLARKLRRYINAYSANARPIRWKYSDPTRRVTSNELTATGH